MIWSVLSNLLNSIDSVFWKKSLMLAKIPKMLFRFFGELAGVLMSIFLVFIFNFDFNLLLDWKLMGSIIFIMLIILASDYISQKVYKTEKISALMPYANLNSVLSLIAGYFLFKDASWIALGISVLVVFITIFTALDFKTLTLPKNFGWVFLGQILNTIETLMTGYFLQQVSGIDYFVLYEIVIVALLMVPILLKREYTSLSTVKPSFYKNRLFGSTAGNISFLIYLFLVSEFGVVVSILLGFLGDGFTLLFSYLFLKEKPAKKDIILIIVISILVGIGFYFK